MKLVINLTDAENKDKWPEVIGAIFEDVSNYLKDSLKIEDEMEYTIAASRLIQPMYQPLATLSKTLLHFEFDSSDVHDKEVDKAVELFHADARQGDALEEIDTAIKKILSDGTVFLPDAYVAEELEIIRKQVVLYVNARVSALLDELWQGITAELISIKFRFVPYPKREKP